MTAYQLLNGATFAALLFVVASGFTLSKRTTFRPHRAT